MSKKKILIVEDSELLLTCLKEILIDIYPDIDIAINGEEALKLLEDNDYFLIIADFKMPVKDGLELLIELRNKKNETPFIFYSAYLSEHLVSHSQDYDVYRYLDKTNIDALESSVIDLKEDYLLSIN